MKIKLNYTKIIILVGLLGTFILSLYQSRSNWEAMRNERYYAGITDAMSLCDSIIKENYVKQP